MCADPSALFVRQHLDKFVSILYEELAYREFRAIEEEATKDGQRYTINM